MTATPTNPKISRQTLYRKIAELRNYDFSKVACDIFIVDGNVIVRIQTALPDNSTQFTEMIFEHKSPLNRGGATRPPSQEK